MNCLVAVVAAIVVVVLRHSPFAVALSNTRRQMSDRGLVFNLRIRAIRKYVLFEGRFNMLKAFWAHNCTPLERRDL